MLGGLCALSSGADARRHGPPSTGLPSIAFAKAPPDFTFDLGAGPRRLEDYLGMPVVLNFWATWCEPCQAELDAFDTLRATYGGSVQLLTFSYEQPGVARAFLQARHLDLPVIEDPERTIFEKYSVTALPVTIVLGRDGTVTHVSIGELEWTELHAAVEAALGARPAVTPATPVPAPGVQTVSATR